MEAAIKETISPLTEALTVPKKRLGAIPGIKLAVALLNSTVLSARFMWLFFRAIIRYLWVHPYQCAFNLAMVGLFSLVVAVSVQMHNQTILAEISRNSVDRIIQASRFTREYQNETVEKHGPRAFLNVGGPEWTQREGVRAILYQSRKAGLQVEDQAVLLAIAEVESGFNPMARAPSTSACGLFQFVRQTGELFGLKQSDCMNPWSNAEAGVAHYLQNYRRKVERSVADLSGAERLLRKFELSYYLHHDGINSTTPTDEVRALVLSGAQFLFRVHTVLLDETASKKEAPTFVRRVNDKFHQWLRAARARSGYYTALLKARLNRRSPEETVDAGLS